MCADAGGNTEMGGGGGEAGVTTRTRPRGERRGGMTRGGARNRGGSRSGSRNGGTERGGRNSGGGRTEKGKGKEKETDKRKENQNQKEKEVSGSTSTSTSMEKGGGDKTHRRGKGKGDKDKSYSHNKGGDKSKNKSKSKEKEGCKKTQAPGGSPPSPPGGNTNSPSGTPPTPPTPTGGNTDSPAGTPPTPPSPPTPPTPPTPTGGNTDSPSGTPPTPPTPTGGNTDSPSGTPPTPPTPPTPTGGNTDSPAGTPPTPPTPPTPTGGETTEPCVDGGEPVEVEVVSPEGTVDSFGAGEPVVQGMHPHGEPSTTLANFPPAFVQANMEAFFPVDIAGVIGADNVLRVACPFNCEEKPCEVFVTTYHCPPCSTPTNGGLVSLLPGAGWEAGSCAPTFQQGVGAGAEGAGGVEHPTVAFRKLVSAGAVEELPALTAPLANAAVFVRQGATACGGFADETACAAMPECAWEAGASEGAAGMCVSSWCPADFTPPASAASCATTCAGAGAVTPGGEVGTGGETGTGAGGEGGEGGEAGTGGFGPF